MVALLTLQVILFVYHQAVTWLDFFPFNNPQQYTFSERVVESLLHGIPFAFSPLAVYFVWDVVQDVTFLAYIAFLGVSIMTWWIPYLAGPGRRWKEQYKKMFSEQVKYIPGSKREVTPVLEAAVQHALLLTVLVLFVLYRI